MKRYTLLVEMRCNLFCTFCGNRAVDEAVRRRRAAVGLDTPRIILAGTVTEKVRSLLRLPGDTSRERHSAKGAFDRETAFAEIERVRQQGYDALNLQGGEPTIWPWLPELVAHARALGFPDVSVVTNGQRLSRPEYAEALYGAGLHHVTFSVVGPDAASHDDLTLRPGSFEKLLSAMDHAAAWRLEHPGTLTVSANVVLHAETVPRLPELVGRLADHGVDQATFHLLRFDLFASVPKVRERLRFPLGGLRGPLTEAWRVGAARGVTLGLEDVPLCQHPVLTGSGLHRLRERAGAQVRHGWAPGKQHRLRSPHRWRTWACWQCSVRRWCTQVPARYQDYKAALEPVNARRLAADFAAVDPSDPQGATLVAELVGAAELLEAEGALAPKVAADLRHRARRALVDRVERAAADGDLAGARAAFYALLGFHPPRGDEGDLEPLEEASKLQFEGAPPPPPDGARRATLAFAPGLQIAVDVAEEGDAWRLLGAVALRPDDEALPGPATRALFLLDILGRLRGARRLRLADETVDLDRGQGLQVAWSRSLAWSVSVTS